MNTKAVETMNTKATEDFPFCWRARAELVACHRMSGNFWIILAENPGNALPYVVSMYESGKDEWQSGSYFKTHKDAVKKFCKLITCQ